MRTGTLAYYEAVESGVGGQTKHALSVPLGDASVSAIALDEFQ